MNRHVCGIVSDEILKNIADKGSDPQKDAAKKTLLNSALLRTKRELAPVPQEHTADEDREIYDAGNTTQEPGHKARSENEKAVKDQAVNEAFDGAGNTYRLYLGEYSRNSIDGKGMKLLSIVHYDRDFDNAFWNGERMIYGDGHFFNPFTRDLTVIGHELTHGVTQHTANLAYRGQSGALNEHISDVFGVLVEQYAYLQSADKASWLIGALLCDGKIKGRALRDMLNPGTAYNDPVIGKDPQPAHMKDFVDTWQDSGGVHINSGIPNKAFAVACIERGGYAWETIGKVWYDVLTKRCKSDTEFQDFSDMTFESAGDLFGKNSPEQDAVRKGWDAVGIKVGGVQPQPTPNPTPTPDPTPHGQSPCAAAFEAMLTDPATAEKMFDLWESPLTRKFRASLLIGLKKAGIEPEEKG
jgi:Zn-dependent metalloprotease